MLRCLVVHTIRAAILMPNAPKCKGYQLELNLLKQPFRQMAEVSKITVYQRQIDRF